MFSNNKKKVEPRKRTKAEVFREVVSKVFFLTLGAFIFAAGLEMFLLPNNIIDGGTTHHPSGIWPFIPSLKLQQVFNCLLYLKFKLY